MTLGFQLVIDCADPYRMVAFWSTALRYAPEEPPKGFESWLAYWRSVGVPEEELVEVVGSESLVDPAAAGPRIWFQRVPEGKQVKNRLHLDVLVGAGRGLAIEQRKALVDAEADRLVAAGASRVPMPPKDPGVDHYGVALLDPEGNEFDVV
jgi:hypothetical protein